MRCGTLPESWIPPGELRDQRELLRTRMALRDLRTSLKHRIHAGIDRYGLQADAISDLFGTKGRIYLASILKALPTETAHMIALQLNSIDQLEEKITAIELRIAEQLKASPEIRLLRTVPGLGPILAPLVWLEVGDVERFPRAEHLASYAGLVPRVISSGGHTRHGGTCRNVNHYLKWAFVEAANCAIRIKAHRQNHIGLLYQRLYPNKGHGRAVVAVARHLAEASYWVLRKRQADPKCSCLFEGEYMAPRRSRLLRANWTAGTTYKEKSKSKNKSKNTAKEKTSSAHRLPRPRQQDFSAPKFLKSPKSKNNFSLDKRRFHT